MHNHTVTLPQNIEEITTKIASADTEEAWLNCFYCGNPHSFVPEDNKDADLARLLILQGFADHLATIQEEHTYIEEENRALGTFFLERHALQKFLENIPHPNDGLDTKAYGIGFTASEQKLKQHIDKKLKEENITETIPVITANGMLSQMDNFKSLSKTLRFDYVGT